LKSFADDNFGAIWGENRRPDFIENQLRDLFRVFREQTALSLIDTESVDEAIHGWRAQGLTASTINHRLSVLSKLLKYGLRRNAVDRLPQLQRQRISNVLERVWSHEDEEKAFLYLDHTGLLATRHVLQFLLYTGARKGEAYALTRGDVRDGWVRFDQTTTKSGRSREIPLVTQAAAAWTYICGLSDLAYSLEVVNRSTLVNHWQLLRDYFDATSDRAFVPHMLRHTCATRLVAGGVPLAQVMKWMGHQSIQVTMRYVYVAPKDLEFAAKVLGGARPMGLA